MAQQDGLGVATVRVGGHEYPYVTQRNCKVCCTAHRTQIEEQAVAGRPWKVIAESLPDDAKISARNVQAHFHNRHLPVDHEAVHQLTERQAEDRGAVVEVGAARVVNYREFAQTVVGRVNHRIAAGEVEPGVGDALRAADLLAKYDPGPQMSEADYAAAFGHYVAATRAVMTPEQYQDFTDRLDANEALQALAARWEEVHSPRVG